MKKPYDFTVRWDDYLCVDCQRPLKANVIARKLNPPVRCYKHHKEIMKELQRRKDES